MHRESRILVRAPKLPSSTSPSLNIPLGNSRTQHRTGDYWRACFAIGQPACRGAGHCLFPCPWRFAPAAVAHGAPTPQPHSRVTPEWRPAVSGLCLLGGLDLKSQFHHTRAFTQCVNAAGSAPPQPPKSRARLEQLPASDYTNVRTNEPRWCPASRVFQATVILTPQQAEPRTLTCVRIIGVAALASSGAGGGSWGGRGGRGALGSGGGCGSFDARLRSVLGDRGLRKYRGNAAVFVRAEVAARGCAGLRQRRSRATRRTSPKILQRGGRNGPYTRLAAWRSSFDSGPRNRDSGGTDGSVSAARARAPPALTVLADTSHNSLFGTTSPTRSDELRARRASAGGATRSVQLKRLSPF